MHAVSSDNRLAFVLRMCEQNVKVLPIWSLHEGFCACPKEAACPSPGKHPLVKHGVKDATFHEEQVTSWAQQFPECNWAAATGARLLVLDVDTKNNHQGLESFQQLQKTCGPLPDTLTITTPTGGFHIYLQVDEELGSPTGIVDGIDLRCEGSYVLIPPSVLAAGPYAIRADHAIAAIPDKWLSFLKENIGKKRKKYTNKAENAPDAVIGEGGRNDFLFRLGASMKAKGFGTRSIYSALKSENEERCYPPLSEYEVYQIANSTERYQPGKPPVEPPSVEAIDAKTEQTEDWQNLLTKNKHGRCKPTSMNLLTILLHDERWKEVIAFDEFRGTPVFRKAPPFALDYGAGRGAGDIEDADDSRFSAWFERMWGMVVPPQVFPNLVHTVAVTRRIHPVREYLDKLVWDEQPRLSSWLHRYAGVDIKRTSSSIARWFLLGAVARIYQPGCKMDSVLVLEGAQGSGKSTLIRLLFSPWYTDEMPDLRNAQAVGLNLRNIWCVELAELTATMNQTPETVKRVLSQSSDRYRAPYAIRVAEYPRQCVFVGTTNQDSYLSDVTGARRWWPVAVGKIDLEALRRDRDQLWAEAVRVYKSGESWWPQTDMARDAFEDMTGEREMVDPWMSELIDYLKHPANKNVRTLTTAEVFTKVLALPIAKTTNRDEQRAGGLLRRLGWQRRQIRLVGKKGVRVWHYEKPPGFSIVEILDKSPGDKRET